MKGTFPPAASPTLPVPALMSRLFVGIVAAAVLATALVTQPTTAAAICTRYNASAITVVQAPAQTKCVDLYSTATGNPFIESVQVTPVSGDIVITGTLSAVAIIEFYSDTGCTTYIASSAVDCTPTTGTTPPPTTPPPTLPPTTPPPTMPPTTPPSGQSACYQTSPSTLDILSAPVGTKCIIVYAPAGNMIAKRNVVLSANNDVMLSGLTNTAAIVEFFGVNGCTTNEFGYIPCVAGQPPTLPPTTQPPTLPPTTVPPTTAVPTTPSPTTSAPPTTNPNAPTCSTSYTGAGNFVTISTHTPFACVILYEIVPSGLVAISSTAINYIGQHTLPATSLAGPYLTQFYPSITDGQCSTTGNVADLPVAYC